MCKRNKGYIKEISLSRFATVIILSSFLILSGCQKSMERTDFSNLVLPASPNYALILPEGSDLKPDFIAPKVNLSVDKLSEKTLEIVRQQPRIKLIFEDKSMHQYAFIQRTLIFRFPDQIDIKFVSLGENQSTFYVLSRSQYGYYDFGKNKSRLKAWLQAWEQALKQYIV